jgi:hypothetical protein
MKVVIAKTIGSYGRIEYLAAANTFPGVEGANMGIEFFPVHFCFALGAFHLFSPPGL